VLSYLSPEARVRQDHPRSYSGNLPVENRNGLIVNAWLLEANGRGGARCGAADAEAGSGEATSDCRRRLPIDS